jgi:hypothetical protein
MPCDQIILTHCEFLPNTTDVKLLKLALEAQGFTVRETATGLSFTRGYREQGSYEKRSGKLTLPESVDGNSVKVGYSTEVVKEQASKLGWNDSWDVDEEGNPTVEISKRGW